MRAKENRGTRFQTKTLSADLTAIQDIADLTFSNLVIGRSYRISGMLLWAGLAAGGDIVLASFYDGTSSDTVIHKSRLGDDIDVHSDSFSFLYTATNTVMTTRWNSKAGSITLSGDGTRSESYLQIEELPNHVQTSDFT
jgi:hypothetical protein